MNFSFELSLLLRLVRNMGEKCILLYAQKNAGVLAVKGKQKSRQRTCCPADSQSLASAAVVGLSLITQIRIRLLWPGVSRQDNCWWEHLGLSTLLLKGGCKGASYIYVLLKLCSGEGWTATTTWPLRNRDSNSESGYFLFPILLLQSCLLWFSFLFPVWLYLWFFHFGDSAGCPDRKTDSYRVFWVF